MCSKKDIDAILEQLKNCQDSHEKRRILEEADPCSACAVKNSQKSNCSNCPHHAEFINILMHIRQKQ
jgi:hypothetical protein